MLYDSELIVGRHAELLREAEAERLARRLPRRNDGWRRDLAVARYNAILNQLRLKAAAGPLRDEDLEEVNRALEL